MNIWTSNPRPRLPSKLNNSTVVLKMADINMNFTTFLIESIKLFPSLCSSNNELLVKNQQTETISFSDWLSMVNWMKFIKYSNTNFPSFMSKSISDVKHIRIEKNSRVRKRRMRRENNIGKSNSIKSQPLKHFPLLCESKV